MATDIFGYTKSGGRNNIKKQDNKNLIVIDDEIGLIQGWNVSYTQQLVPVYECGSADVWFAGSSPIGQLTVQRVVGGKGSLMSGTLCDPKEVEINMNGPGCDGGVPGQRSLALDGCVTTAVTWSGQAQSALIQEGVTIQFTYLMSSGG